jgi:hypothetical protein
MFNTKYGEGSPHRQSLQPEAASVVHVNIGILLDDLYLQLLYLLYFSSFCSADARHDRMADWTRMLIYYAFQKGVDNTGAFGNSQCTSVLLGQMPWA